MQIKRQTVLIDAGEFSASQDFKDIMDKIHVAIKKVVHPPGSEKFTIYPQSGKKTGEGNGVKPIKLNFLSYLSDERWILESTNRKKKYGPGPYDASIAVGKKFFVVEWETGNISSSHRAMNKMCLGILQGDLIGGILILPTRELYQYLTDRVGNYPELEPYFPLWHSIPCEEGYLSVIAIEHDATSYHVPRIPKGTDGMARV